jgi:hypothetical protein
VEVTGSADLDAPEPAARPLVADAGDSPLPGSDGIATLLGAGFGGVEPYTFSWSSPVAKLTGADAPTAQLDTSGVPDGDYPVTLRVTDAKGTTATDTVTVAVRAVEQLRLLDETRQDPTPGVLGVGAPGALEFPYDVPGQVLGMQVTASWGPVPLALRPPRKRPR